VVRYEVRGMNCCSRDPPDRAGSSIVGSGKVDMKTEALRLTFLTGAGGKIPAWTA